MAQTARKVAPEAPSLTKEQQTILAEVADKPEVVLTDGDKFAAFLEAVKAEIALDPGDVATERGRERIRSNAAGVSRRKTPIEKAGLRLTEEWRKKVNLVNAAKKHIGETMDGLRDEVRAPLTAWEEGEAARKAEAQAIIDDMMQASVIRPEDTVPDLQERLDRIRGRNLSDEMFGPRIEMVTDLRDSTVKALVEGIERIEQAERDRAELERLRAAEAQRIADEEARKAKEQAEKEAQERAAREEQQRKEREAAEAERVERERREAAEAAQRAAEEKARREQEERDRAAQAEIDAANEKVRLAQQEAYERKLIQHIMDCGNGLIGGSPYPYVILLRELDEKVDLKEFEVLGEEATDAHSKARAKIVEGMERAQAKEAAEEEQRQREADQAHRRQVKTAAKEAIMTCGVDEETARKIVTLIQSGEVPHVSIHF